MAVLAPNVRDRRRTCGAAIVAAVAALVLVPAAYFVTQNETVAGSNIAGYHVVDDRTIVITVVVPPQSWTRVAHVLETPLAVRVTVDTLPLPGLGSATAKSGLEDVSVELAADLGERTVADGAGVAMEEREADH